MRAWLGLVIAGTLVVLSPLARAEAPAPKAPGDEKAEKAPQKDPGTEKTEKAPHDRVHLGATSVTVVDEHETVDDVITRLRSAKAKTGTASKTSSGETVHPPATTANSTRPQDGRAALQRERDNAAAHADADRPRDERRERAAGGRARVEKKQRR